MPHSDTPADPLTPEVGSATPLAAAGVSCRLGGRTVLDAVDLNVEPGEVVALLGPNGSGKTTLLHGLSGIRPLDAGTVHVAGRPLNAWRRRELARRLAVLPQEDPVPFRFTAREIVALGRHPHLAGLGWTGPEDDRVIDRALDACGATHLGDRPVRSLSSGERQRVLFARVLAQRPGLMLLDEPTTFLDVRHVVALHRQVRHAAERGAAVLIVLHDLQSAVDLCDRVYLMREGRILVSGPVGEVFRDGPLSEAFGTPIGVRRDAGERRIWVGPRAGTREDT